MSLSNGVQKYIIYYGVLFGLYSAWQLLRMMMLMVYNVYFAKRSPGNLDA